MIKLSVIKTNNLKEKTIGLIGKNKPQTLMIETRFGIHTFGLKFPIDVLVLNNRNIVASFKENLKPNRIFLWNPIYSKIIELPAGMISEYSIKINMPIDICVSKTLL
jgi:uncharacterized protein